MTKQVATKTFNDLPQWAKGVIAVGVVVGGGYLLYKYVLKPKSGTEVGQSEVEEEIITAQEQKKLSYPKSAYYSMADAIETAVNGIGTDEQLIYTTFRKLKNDADFLMLKKAFGIRNYNGDYLPYILTRAKWGLEATLQNEMSSTELGYVNAILKKAKIKYRV
jgi:hypothetical protein